MGLFYKTFKKSISFEQRNSICLKWFDQNLRKKVKLPLNSEPKMPKPILNSINTLLADTLNALRLSHCNGGPRDLSDAEPSNKQRRQHCLQRGLKTRRQRHWPLPSCAVSTGRLPPLALGVTLLLNRNDAHV